METLDGISNLIGDILIGMEKAEKSNHQLVVDSSNFKRLFKEVSVRNEDIRNQLSKQDDEIFLQRMRSNMKETEESVVELDSFSSRSPFVPKDSFSRVKKLLHIISENLVNQIIYNEDFNTSIIAKTVKRTTDSVARLSRVQDEESLTMVAKETIFMVTDLLRFMAEKKPQIVNHQVRFELDAACEELRSGLADAIHSSREYFRVSNESNWDRKSEDFKKVILSVQKIVDLLPRFNSTAEPPAAFAEVSQIAPAETATAIGHPLALDEAVRRLMTALGRLNKAYTDPNLKEFQLSVKNSIQSAREEAARTTDLAARERLLRLADELESLDLNDPKNIERAKEILRRFAESAPKDPKKIHRELEANLDQFLDSMINKDHQKAGDFLRNISDQVQAEIQLGTELAKQHPTHKVRLEGAVNTLKEKMPELVRTTRKNLENPDSNTISELKSTVGAIKEASEQITADLTVVERPKIDGNLAILDIADDLSKATLDSKMSPHKRMVVDFTNSIAEEMRKISVAAKTGNKSMMIEAAKAISLLVQQIEKTATGVAEECTDALYKKRLLDALKVPGNFATQLKIISAVKATSVASDKSAESQLIHCARALGQSVIATLDACQSAQLRSRSG
eukprot:TRINITY_DN5470_c0_g1_i1.p1 TRINITY_DN5470_c0_g1~~TRINITY_DN5470_c0_g1_i1.p1  ORF type:complete len:634 (-),score=185.57 TRINITY_DN5470_c0_g1_i1:47-1918(-)